jgi:hypothetical protein
VTTVDPLREALTDASRMLQDAALFIDAQGDLMAALRLGGRTPEKALRTLDRLHGIRGRMATEWLTLDALALDLERDTCGICHRRPAESSVSFDGAPAIGVCGTCRERGEEA